MRQISERGMGPYRELGTIIFDASSREVIEELRWPNRDFRLLDGGDFAQW